MRFFVNLIDKYATPILFAVFVVTLLMIPGLRKISVVQEAAENSFTAPNELISSVLNVKKSFDASTRLAVISVEAQGGWKITESHTLELINNVSNALKSVPLIRKESVLSLATVSDFKNTDEGLSAVPMIEGIPQNKKEETALRKKIAQNSFVYGKLVSKDFKTTIILGSIFDKATLEEAHHQIAKAIEPFQNQIPGTVVTLVGEPEINYQLHSSIVKDIYVFVLISILLILISFYLLFRTWHGVVLPLIAISVGIVWTMGIIGYYGEPITIISATLPVVLVVIGSACSIHVFHNLMKETEQGFHFKQAFTRVLKHIFSPLMMSTITAFIGGISLLMFKIRPIQHFGLFTAVGTLISLAVAIIVIPCFFKLLRKPIRKIERTVSHGFTKARNIASSSIQQVPIAGPMTEALAETVTESIKGGVAGFWQGARFKKLLERGLSNVAHLVDRHPVMIIVSVVFVMAVSLHYTRKIEIGFDSISFLPNNNSIKQTTQRIDSAFGGVQNFELSLDTKKAKGALDHKFLKKVSEFEKAAAEVSGVTYAFSVVDVLKKVHTVLNPEAKSKLPPSASAISQYLLLLSMSSNSLSLSSLITSDYQKLRLLLTISPHDTKEIAELYFKLKGLAHTHFGDAIKVEIGGGPVVWVALMHYIVWGKIQNMFLCMLLILLTVAIVHRSITRGMITILTLPIGVLANFGLMGYLGIRLDIVTAIITSFAMGIGVEFSIHLISAIKDAYKKTGNISHAIRDAITVFGQSIVYNALCNIVGFSALLFSRFSAIHTFALLMCFSMAVLLIASLVVLPAVIRLVPPEFITNYRKNHHISERRLSLAMKVAFSSFVVVILSLGILYIDLKAAEPSAADLVKRSVQAIYTNNEEATYAMKLVDSSGSVNTRRMKVWFKSNGDENAKLLIKFLEPADIRATGFLTIVEKGKAPDQWLYLPALKKSRRVKGGNSDESFLGSDFTMGDLSVNREENMDFTVKGNQKCGDAECFLLVGTPKAGADMSKVKYSKKTMLIRKDNYMGVSAEFFNSTGQLEKVLTFHGVRKVDGKRWVVDKIEMKNVVTNHSTVLEAEKRDSSRVIGDHVFTQNYLEKN